MLIKHWISWLYMTTFIVNLRHTLRRHSLENRQMWERIDWRNRDQRHRHLGHSEYDIRAVWRPTSQHHADEKLRGWTYHRSWCQHSGTESVETVTPVGARPAGGTTERCRGRAGQGQGQWRRVWNGLNVHRVRFAILFVFILFSIDQLQICCIHRN